MKHTSSETLERRIFAGRGSRILAATTITALAVGAGLGVAPAANAAEAVGTISGTVEVGGGLLESGDIYLEDLSGDLVSTTTVTDGDYELTGIAVGDYTLSVNAWEDDRYSSERYGVEHDSSDAPEVIHVTDGSTFTADFDYLWTISANGNAEFNSSPAVGTSLVYTPRTWYTEGVNETFQWFKDEIVIPGAINLSLPVVADYVGADLKMVQTTTKDSTFYPYITYLTEYVDGPPLVNGYGDLPEVIAVGDTISVKITQAWKPAATSYTYEWYVSTEGNSTETVSSSDKLLITPQMLGKEISVNVTGHRSGYVPETVTVSSNEPVVGPQLKAAKPVVTGTVKQGSTLTATPAAWNQAGVATSYQWFEEWGGYEYALKGATKSTYKIPAVEAGAKLSVKVTGTKSGFQSATIESSVTKAVPYLKMTLSAAPKLSGTFKVGKTVKAKAGKFSQKGVQIFYVWNANGKPFAGTEKGSVKLTKLQKGKKITVTSYGYKPGYAQISKTSKASKKVK